MIDIYVKEIRRALKDQCYFPALALALALPDICGMAEFPHLRVTDRYMAWYDKYLGQAMVRDGGAPYLSGEVVYNLRNTFLHQGSPSVQSDKVREEVNQIDKFILLLGDGTEVHELSVTGRTGTETFKLILVDVTYLCTSICDAALWYYTRRRDKFQTDFDVVPQSDFRAAGGFAGAAARLAARNYGGPVSGNPPSYGGIFGSQGGASHGGAAPHGGGASGSRAPDSAAGTPKREEKAPESREMKEKPPESKAEHQFRSFFGEAFREKKYRDRREDIITAVLSARTRAQLTRSLMKLFPAGDVKVILQRLEPQWRNLAVSRQTEKTAPEAGTAAEKGAAPQENASPPKPPEESAKSSQARTEHQLRCYFGQNFKEKKYREKREDILGAVLSARSRQQLNSRLTKLFPGEDVKVILQRFREQIKDLPGR